MDRQPCQHIMDSGRPCSSPPLHRGRYCYWHNKLHTEHHFPGNPNYQPPILDSPNAVLLALNHVFRAQSLRMIDDRTARELRSTLRLAFDVVRRLDVPKPQEIITDLEKHLGPDTVLTPSTHDVAAPRSAGVSPAVTQASSPVPQPPPSADTNPFLRKPPQPDHTNFTQLVDSPAADLPLSREEERKLRSLVRGESNR